MRIAIADFEAVKLANGRSLIHNISIVTGGFDHVKKWKSYGTGHAPLYINTTVKSEGCRIDIRIKNSMKNPAIELSDHTQRKLIQTSLLAEQLGFIEVEVSTLRQALRVMLDFIRDNSDGVLMSHALDRDLEFLFDTAHVLNEKKIFKKDFLFRPEVGCYLSGWDGLTLVCTQRLLSTLCPKFDKEVSKTQPDTRLQSYASFIYGSDYVQSHTSTGDAYDLYLVLCKAYEMDTFKVDLGKSRMFMKPSLIRTRGCTFSSFPPMTC